MVEFAIVVPVLLMFLFATIDFGRTLFLYNNLQDTARRAARLGAVQGPNPCTSSQQLVKDSVSAWVQEFNNNPQTAASVQQLVSIQCDLATDGVTAVNVKVRIADYPFQAITPLPFLKNLKITKSAGARSEGAPNGF